MAGGDFLQLPVHAGGLGVVNLDAIHAEVAVAGVGVAGDDAGERDETAAVQRPAFLDGQIEEGGRRGGCGGGLERRGRARPGFGAGGRGVEFMDDVLAGAGLDGFGFGMAEVERGAEEFDGFAEAGGGSGLDERAQFRGGFVQRIEAEAPGHAAVGAEGIDGQGEWGDLAVDGRLLEEEGLAAAGFFHFPVGEFGDFQFGGDGVGNPAEFAGLFQGLEEVLKGIEGHSRGRIAERRAAMRKRLCD